jgi:hypothetical protein
LDENYIEAFYNLGLCNYELNRYDLAIENYKMAIKYINLFILL